MRRQPARNRADYHSAVMEALAEERANALGRAGRRLEDAVDAYRLLLDVDAADEGQRAAARDDVRDKAWALMVQRECAGFRSPDLSWLRVHYDLPDEVLRRL